jgi:5-methylcytosine-specific restriction enzyme subunit McrC
MHGSPYLHCEFQRLTHDLEDNQILLWTLYRISRAGLQRPEVIRAVRQAYRVLSGTVKLTEKGAEDCIKRFYHRLNDDYRLLHGLCRLLLEHLGPDINLGDRVFLPFQLDIPILFELFVAEWLKQNAPQEWIVAAHHDVTLKANAELTFNIDLLLKDKQSGCSIAVLDTKYKATKYPTATDIQQVVAYAVEMGVNRAFLVYPGKNSQAIKAQVGDIEVNSVSFDLSTNLTEAGLSFLEDLVSMLATNNHSPTKTGS